MNTRTLVIVVGSVIAALLVGVIVALFLVLGEMQRQESNEAYRDCMARYGFAHDAPPPAISDDDQEALEEYVGAMAAAAERCGG